MTLFDSNRGYAIILLLSLSYLIFDELVIRLFWHDPWADKMTRQMSLHHYIVSFYYFGAFFAGYSTPSMVSTVLICELSTLFLNISELMPNKSGKCHFTMQLLFVVSFILTRLVLMPYALVLNFACVIGIWHKISLFRRFCTIIQLIFGVAIQCLMFLWAYYIVDQIVKLVKGEGGSYYNVGDGK